MNARIEEAKTPLRATVSVPGDKSIGHRAIILSSLAKGKSVIKGLSRGEDNLRTIRAFREMGVRIEETADSLSVHGCGEGRLLRPDNVLDCGNSGTTMRLLCGVLSGQRFEAVLDGDESLRTRPMKRVTEPLRQMGASIESLGSNGCAPLKVHGSLLHAIDYHMPMASAQVKSAILLAGLYAEGRTTVHEPSKSRDHTERMLPQFGVSVEASDSTVHVQGRQGLHGAEVQIPGDLSSAAFLIVAALIVPGSEVTIKNCGINPTRTGLLEVLAAMGADIQVVDPRKLGGENVADIVVRASGLRGVHVPAQKVPATIDEYPILCVAAAVAEGETSFFGAEELRHKESNRIACMASELRKLGVWVPEERLDGMTIVGCQQLRGAVVQSHGDHRVAMALAVAGLRARGGVEVEGCKNVDTSFVGFFEALRGLRA